MSYIYYYVFEIKKKKKIKDGLAQANWALRNALKFIAFL